MRNIGKIIGLAALVSFSSLTVHAQHMGGAPGPSTGGGGGGGGALMGPTGFAVLPNTAPYHPAMGYTSGSESDFIPSTWARFDQAIAQGQAELNAPRKSMVQIAEESRKTQKIKARFAIVEDQDGQAVIEKQ